MLKSLLSVLTIAAALQLFGQNQTEIGQWREHIPYQKSNSVTAAGDIIYCGSEAAFTAFNINTGELKRYTMFKL